MGEFNELLISRDISDEETIKKIEKKTDEVWNNFIPEFNP